MGNKSISDIGIKMIQSFEGLSLKACKAVPTEKYWTIGYGHYGADVKQGQVITKEQADAMFRKDIQQFNAYVNNKSLCPFTEELNQNQFDALVSFCYNCGPGNLKKLCSGATVNTVADKMLAYNKSGGVVLKGLTRRRTAEKELFNKPVATTQKTTTSTTSKITASTSNSSVYYSMYTGSSTMIDTVFKAIGVPDKYRGSYSKRKPIATANGIKSYAGTSAQNIKLVELAKKGMLKKA